MRSRCAGAGPGTEAASRAPPASRRWRTRRSRRDLDSLGDVLTERALPLHEAAGLLPGVFVGGAVPQVAAGFGGEDADASADAGLARFLVHQATRRTGRCRYLRTSVGVTPRSAMASSQTANPRMNSSASAGSVMSTAGNRTADTMMRSPHCWRSLSLRAFVSALPRRVCQYFRWCLSRT